MWNRRLTSALEELQQDLLVDIDGQEDLVRGHVARQVRLGALQEVRQHSGQGDDADDVLTEPSAVVLAAGVAVRPAGRATALLPGKVRDHLLGECAAELLCVGLLGLWARGAPLAAQHEDSHFRT